MDTKEFAFRIRMLQNRQKQLEEKIRAIKQEIARIKEASREQTEKTPD